MTTTSIEWTQRPGTTGKTWNPTNGCEVCSPGCANCYAMRFAGRFSKRGERYHGLVAIAKNKRAVWTGDARLEHHMLELPFSWRKPCTVFVNSMSDLFYDGFTNEEIAQVFGVMALCPQHTFIILTKRARRMREWFAWAGEMRHALGLPGHAGAALGALHTWPLPNVWIGVSAENRDSLTRLDDLRAIPAAVRLVSFEPLLEDLDAVDLSGIHWAIVGCESGPGARSVEVDAIRSLREQCRASGVAFFVKQARETISSCPHCGGRDIATIVASSSFAMWKCRCGPASPGGIPALCGGPGSKRKPGGVIALPYLDGVQHAAYPEAP